MRSVVPLPLIARLALCVSLAQAPRPTRAVPADVLLYLVNTATSDIHAHHPPPGRIQFRHARIGTLPPQNGATFYLICGEFAGVTEGQKPTWTPFVTIKMEDYEQWLGEQASKDWCQHRHPTWDPRTDVTAALQAKYDSL